MPRNLSGGRSERRHVFAAPGASRRADSARPAAASQMPVDAESARAFAKFDTDGSGSISWRELHEMLKELGLDGDAPHAKVCTGM